MPNWCDTTYKCVSDDKKELRELKKVLDANFKRKTSRVRNGFGKLWIGNVIDQLGYDWHDYRCRGEITDYSLKGNVLTISQCTAWVEQEGFRHVLKKNFPGMKVYYLEEEPGCEVFHTNDTEGTYFPDRYFLDSYDEPMYFETLEEAAKYVSGVVGHEVNDDFDSIEEALDNYVESQDDDVFYSFHEITVCD